MAAAVTTIVCQSFVLVQAQDYPPEMGTWKERATRLRDSYFSRSVQKKEHLTKMLQFFNGDLQQTTIVHYCVFDNNGVPCCKDMADARTKALRLAVPFLSAGYPVPLLYRFKHFDTATGYVHVGTRVHSLLTRAMTLIDCDAAALLSGAGIDPEFLDKILGEQNQDVENLPGITLDEDVSYQAANLKRKQLVKAEVASPAFAQSTTIVSAVIQPMDALLNMLFHRTGLISKLTLIGPLDPHWQDMACKSKDFFLRFVAGSVGHRIIESYQDLLMNKIHQDIASGLLSAESCLGTVLTMAIICITDTWRRFVHNVADFPHILFCLVGTDLATFCKMWDHCQERFQQCPDCVDHEFSRVLLSSFPGKLAGKPIPEQESVQTKVSAILADIATYSPLSSERVECKNGKVQAIVSRRGNQAVKAPVSAREASFLQSSIQAHELVKLYVDEDTLPSKKSVAGILRAVQPKVPWQLKKTDQ